MNSGVYLQLAVVWKFWLQFLQLRVPMPAFLSILVEMEASELQKTHLKVVSSIWRWEGG